MKNISLSNPINLSFKLSLQLITVLLFLFSPTLIQAKCPSSDKDHKIQCLGEIKVRDDVMKGEYEYFLFKKTDKKTGDYLIRLLPGPKTQTPGSSIERDKSIRKAMEFAASGVQDTFYLISELVRSTGSDDPRTVQFRMYFDQGKPSELETFIVARKSNKSPKPPKTLRVKWPEKFQGKPKAKPLKECPDNSSYEKIDCMGYVEAYDAISDNWYHYVVYKETDIQDEEWEVKIRGSNSLTLTERKKLVHS